MPKRTILLADDISNQTDSGKRRSQIAREISSWLASKLGTGIDALYVESLKGYPAITTDWSDIKERCDEHRKQLEAAGRGLKVPVHCLLRTGSPAEEILKLIRSKRPPELVVMGTQGRTGIEHLFLGSVAEEVVRHSSRPTLVIGPVAQETIAVRSLDDRTGILVPTDLGKNSRAAEQYALSLAKRIGAGVTLLHCLWDAVRVIYEGVCYSGAPAFDLDDTVQKISADALKSIKQRVAYFRARGVDCQFTLIDKPIASSSVILEEARKEYGFIVMGTHGRNVLLRAFFGSTARDTILKARIPVITVHQGR